MHVAPPLLAHLLGPLVSPLLPSLDLGWSGVWRWAQGAPLRILVIVVGAALTRWVLHRMINGFVHGLLLRRKSQPSTSTTRVDTEELPVIARGMRRASKIFGDPTVVSNARQEQRVRTLGAVLRSITTVVIVFVAILWVCDELGLNVTPLLASASVGGVALGFGAQSMVKDFLSGMFMIIEDQYGVGDVVDTGDVIGTVEDVSLRLTTIRDFNGVLWYIRNGEIKRVANRSQGWSTALVDIPVPAAESMERVLPIISHAIRGMQDEPEYDGRVISEPEVGGVESIQGGIATVRVIVKCGPNESVPVGRAVRSRVMDALAAQGVSLPVVPAFGAGVLPYGGSNPPTNGPTGSTGTAGGQR